MENTILNVTKTIQKMQHNKLMYTGMRPASAQR